MYRTALVMTGNQADAEDAVQDVFVRLWERRSALAEIGNAEAYAMRMVRNRCVDMIAGRRQNSDCMADAAIHSEDDVGARVESRDRLEHVMDIIGKLPENQRRVLSMRDIDDCPMDEIERQTGLSAVNVRVILSRARSSIRKYFSK